MLTDYINQVMQHARYERIEDGTIFGSIADGELPGFKGVWANADSEATCAQELLGVLEDWVLLTVSDHTPLPVVDGLTLEVGRPA